MAALSGVRVIDLTQFEAGTTCTLALAWLGADVIKIERPGHGDQARQAAADMAGVDSHYFLVLNANKRSLTLDLKSDKGREIVLELIEKADVFVENFAPGTIERLGLDYDAVQARNPRIIYAQVKGFDVDGPYGNFLCFDPVGQAAGGAFSLNGYADGPPLKPGVNLADTGSGMHLVVGVLAALYQRQQSGEGQRVQVNMQESVINYCRVAFHQQMASGRAVGRCGNRPSLHNAPAGLYKCKGDGANDYVMIHCSQAGNAHWHNLLDLLGRAHLKDDPRFASAEARWEHTAEIDAIVSAWTQQYDKHEVMRLLGDSQVPASAVFDTYELSTDTHLVENGTFVDLQHPTRGNVRIPGWCVRLSGSDVPVTAAPLLGEHTDDVLSEIAGLNRDDVDALRQEGVI